MNYHSSPNSVLIDFDAIVDYKIGLVRFFKRNEYRMEHLNKDYINNSTDRFRIDRIFNVEDIVKLALDQYAAQNYEELTKQFLNSEHEFDIYTFSTFTAVYRMAKVLISNSEVMKLTIYCRNKTQKQFIDIILPKANVILCDPKKVDLSVYGKLILGRIESLDEFNKPNMMNISIVGFRENFEKDNPKNLKLKYIATYGDTNEFTIVDSYTLKTELKG